jgi:murein DD-endopeptidase MepM/ murein hydrolase activator NlpD
MTLGMCLLLALLLPQDEDEAGLAAGRDLTARFYQRDLDALFDEMSAALRAVFGDVDGFETFRDQIDVQLGEEVEVVKETAQKQAGSLVYTRIARFEKQERKFQITWNVGPEEQIDGFGIAAVPVPYPSKFLDYQTRTVVRLPFDGPWYVFWGGRILEENYHAFTRDQRFAYDILIWKDGTSHAGDGKENEDYFCFGQPILAPAAGTVVASANDVPDNVPGVLNPRQPLGNHVILDHGNGEYSFLAHFQLGTVEVEAGDTVESADLLGLCGNSGNSSEAHLHYHLQNAPEFGVGDGLPLAFVGFSADGETIARGELRKGQTVEHAPPADGSR